MNTMGRKNRLLAFCFCTFLSILFSYRLYNIIDTEYEYLPTICTINKIYITKHSSRRVGMQGYNLLHVDVMYIIDGIFYDSELDDNAISGDFKDDAFIKKFLTLYPINSKQPCWYSPSRHTVILNKVKNFYLTVFEWVIVILVFIGIAIFYSIIPGIKKLKEFMRSVKR